MLIVQHYIPPFPVFVGRYANPGDSPLRHTSNAGQCAGTVLLCLLHLRHCWGAAVGRATTEPLLHERRCQNVSCYSNRQMSAHQEAVTVPLAYYLYCFSCYFKVVINICSGPSFSHSRPKITIEGILCAVSQGLSPWRSNCQPVRGFYVVRDHGLTETVTPLLSFSQI